MEEYIYKEIRHTNRRCSTIRKIPDELLSSNTNILSAYNKNCLKCRTHMLWESLTKFSRIGKPFLKSFRPTKRH
jgi:hypothetical protein